MIKELRNFFNRDKYIHKFINNNIRANNNIYLYIINYNSYKYLILK